MFWLAGIRGWFIAGHLWLILLGQILLYSAYALISSTVVLATQNLAKSFGFIAVYGGSSLSFAGVTLPLNNAPLLQNSGQILFLIPLMPNYRQNNG